MTVATPTTSSMFDSHLSRSMIAFARGDHRLSRPTRRRQSTTPRLRSGRAAPTRPDRFTKRQLRRPPCRSFWIVLIIVLVVVAIVLKEEDLLDEQRPIAANPH
jgi:hypothetical protein